MPWTVAEIERRAALDRELAAPLSAIDRLRLHVHDPDTFEMPEPEDLLDEIDKTET